jgi:hemoglobin-like flavoprotein
MTSEEKKLVQESFAKIKPISAEAAAMFYGRLFEIAPQFRPMFKSDITEQGKKLMQMIGIAVANLDNLDEVTPAVQALGLRHKGYGVEPAHYPVVGEALLWAVGQALGDGYTPEIEQAWQHVYNVMAETMQQAAEL